MFHVHRSNRMEELVFALADLVRAPLASPLEPEVVLVQSKGMERWASLELSRRLGVFANARFPFPRAFVDELLAAVLREPEEAALAWSRESLTWAIAACLPELAPRPELALVRSYVAHDPDGLRGVQLADRIAHVFDQYAVYRPELVLGWERGDEPRFWQAQLWRALIERIGSHHVAGRAARFSERWGSLAELPPELPSRLCILGVSALPPIYLSLLAALAARIDVHLFQLAPSQEYWGQVQRADDGNALLASLGASGRDFARVLESSVDYVEGDAAKFVDPGTDTLLHALQSDVLRLRLRGAGGDVPPLPLDPLDRSIEIHSCHGPLREIEVLRDRLLGLFQEDPSLKPHDVVVMMPDVDAYAPLIDATFGVASPGDPLAIPYRIADRAERSDSAVAQALVAVLELLSGRMKASEVLDLLELEPVRLRFGIAADDVARIQRLVHESGVRWGVDAGHREAIGQPPIAENTWRFGLDRLLLGWAMPGRGETLFHGTLPYDDVEGDSAEIVGRFAELAEVLFALRERLEKPRTVREWRTAIGELVSATLQTDEIHAWQLRKVRELVAAIAEDAARAGHTEPVTLAVMARALGRRLEQERSTHQFLTGGVTFCALLPMRSIPFRVVCLLGMADDQFPRRDRAPAFDRIAERPRAGDRSLRDEDRYLFLEALLSARERLLLSFVGRGIQDDRPRPPSVVVGELVDAIDDGFSLRAPESKQKGRRKAAAVGQLAFGFVEPAPEPAARVSERLVLQHPLQPFSPRYFGAGDDTRLWSFAADEARGARALAAARTTLAPFARVALAADDADTKIEVEALARFFENPARGYLRRLGVDLTERPELVEDREPIDPSALAQYGVGQRLVERALRGDDLAQAEELLRAEGLLPIGAPGRAWFSELVPEAVAIGALARKVRGSERLPPLPVELPIGGALLTGTLENIWQGAQLRCGYSRIKAKSLVALWIRHLVLCSVSPFVSVLIGRPRKRDQSGVACARFRPLEPEPARRHLAELVELYRLGRRAPLCFFPSAAEVYVDKLARGDAELALAAARRDFGDVFGFGESTDPAVARLFADVDPFATGFALVEAVDGAPVPDFVELAERVFSPLRAHVSEEGG